MTTSEPGNSLKPAAEDVKKRIAEAVAQIASDGKISCAAAHGIAEQLNVPPEDVGRSADLLKIRLNKCLLGLFGYTPHKKIVKASEKIAPELEAAIRKAAAENQIACDACWDIAETLACARLDVAAACEALAVKIAPCQLGAF